MKSGYFMLFILLSLMATQGQASEPKIIETDNGFVVEYTGDPIKNQRDNQPGINASPQRNEEIQREKEEAITRLKEKVRILDEEIAKKKEKNMDVTFSNFEVKPLSQAAGYTTFSVKIDLYNPSDKSAYLVKVAAKDRSGFELRAVYLQGMVDSRGSKTLTDTAIINNDIANRIYLWEVALVVKN